jgi:hypothetical protein
VHSVLGAAVGWIPLAVALAVAATGAASLVGGSWPARIASGVAFAWNPWVYDRLAVGQVSVLAGYAVLPWLARAAMRAKTWRGALTVGAWWAFAGACTLHFAWIGGVVVVAITGVRARELEIRRTLAGVGLAVGVAAAVFGAIALGGRHAAPPTGDARVLTSFATTSDPDLGRSLGLLAQQGFWRPSAHRPRDDLGAFFPAIAGLSIGSAALGLWCARGTTRARLAGGATIAAGAGWLLAHGSAGPTGSAYRFLFEHLPGFGAMREAQKWSALVSLAMAVGTGCLALAISATRARRAAWVVVAVPFALAPTLAWGLDGRIRPSRYPVSWVEIRRAVDALHGDVVALPWEQYVRSGLTGNRTTANPAPSYFGARVVASRDPGVRGLSADTGRRAQVSAAIADARADAAAGRPLALGPRLARLGFRAVLVLGAPEVPLERDRDLTRSATADGVTLWVVGGSP